METDEEVALIRDGGKGTGVTDCLQLRLLDRARSRAKTSATSLTWLVPHLLLRLL
jgi:hypothetical protein